MTYGLDGEGRATTLKEGTETIVAGTTFNASGQPTYIDLGTGTDQSDYIYDPSTGRMTNWAFQVGSSSETGALTWNANGTLGKLAIVDGFNSAGSQTCTFGHDDLVRLLSDNCGSAWAQTFSYDQYDNLTKSGSITWNPGYNPVNNHYSTGANYDNSGNLTYDTIHLYTWDQFNKLSSIDSSACATNGECITYDALGRAVETSYEGAYTEIWYTQLGKAVYMQGSTPFYAYFPTPGGGTVEVNGNAATNYYMHKDWLGNSRISSTVISHTVISDQAYAPFGEVYNKEATGAATPGQMFTGDVQNIISGIFDTPNRELNASQGRWLSPDPANSGWNQYGYVSGNPLSYIDPSGLACWPFEKQVVGTCSGFMNNGVNFGGNWSELYILTAALSGSYEAPDPSKPWLPMGDLNGQLIVGGCNGIAGCEGFEVPQMMTVYPNIGLLGMLSATTITVTATDPTALIPSPSSQAAMIALHNAFSKFPDLCNPSVGATVKVGPAAVNVNLDQGGASVSPSLEGGPFSMESPSKVSVNVGEGLGGTVTGNPQNGTITGVSLFAGFKSSLAEFSANVQAAVVNMFSCPNN